MQLKLTKTAVRIGAVCALAAAAALGFTQAALAAPAQGAVSVPCSAAALASAITGASSGETLNLAKFCVYKLTEALPEVGTDLTINGNQSTIERSYASGTDDFTILDNDGELVLNKVNFRNGDSDSDFAGAIYNDDELTVNGGTFTGNTSNEYGGAIYNEDDATVTGSTFTSNASLDDEYGGAIYADDDMTVTSSNFTKNSAEDGGYGGAIYIAGKVDVTVTGSGFSQNSADEGGGIYNDGGLALRGGGFTGNTAEDYGGGIFSSTIADETVTDAAFRLNQAGSYGGGIYDEGDDATVTAS